MAATSGRRLLHIAAALVRPSAVAQDVHVHWHLPEAVKNMSPAQLAALTGGATAAVAPQPQPQPQPQPEPEPEAVPPPSPQQVRQRLVVLGQHASIEVSPAQAGAPTAPGATPLKYTLASALDGAARPPLPPGATCFVNMVKTQEAHFSDVIAAVNALTRRGILPVPHVPACRFDSEGAVVSFLILHG